MTFVDGSIYIHQTFLTITLGKGVDFIIPVEIGYPTPGSCGSTRTDSGAWIKGSDY